MKIRKATIKDLQKIAKLSLEYDRYENSLDSTHEVVPLKQQAKIHGVYLKKENYIFLVAEKNKKIIGWINGDIRNEQDKKIGVFHSFIITESERGKGYGSVLFQAMMNHFIKNKCEITRSFVLETNKDALKFYKNLGFKAIRKTIKGERGYQITKKLKK